MAQNATRPRAGSVQKTIEGIDHLHTAVPAPVQHAKSARRRAPKPYDSGSLGLWRDLYTMRWMRVPESSLKLLGIPAALWAGWELVARVVPPGTLPVANPFSRLLFVSHPLHNKDGSVSYAKDYNDLWFLAYWVICFSFIRLFWTVYVFHPMARSLGVRGGKVIRYGEQGYAVVYFAFMGSLGIYVMSQLPTWYYNLTPQWTEYPQWKMTPALKTYYLLHFAYWLQQFLVLVLKLEKPRRDFAELVVHHIVTLWLVGWSYLVNLTWIGNLVFMTMDWSDVLFAMAKMCNYMKQKRASEVVFVVFLFSWTYGRHYLNLYMLYSVWYEFDKIPQWAQRWAPEEGVWMVWWMKYQIWVPIALLQIVNLFWYFRIWRVFIRAIRSSELEDERSDDEDEELDEDTKKKD